MRPNLCVGLKWGPLLPIQSPKIMDPRNITSIRWFDTKLDGAIVGLDA